MKKIFIVITFITFSLNIDYSLGQEVKKKTLKVVDEKKYLIKTDYGDIIIKLYNETPNHRDNFIKLVNEKFYDSLLFHRVIKDFMIQGGDPQSKNAAPTATLGNGENGYTISPEFNPKFIHKKGALAAARLGDNVNPQKNSSGCQFYIVQGRKFGVNDLTSAEANINNQIKQQIFGNWINKPENINTKNTLIRLQKNQNQDSLKTLSEGFNKIVEAEFSKIIPFKYSPEQIKEYTENGGTPHLDLGYTVFGEVVSGLEVIDKIAEIEKGASDRPKKDVMMTIKEYIK